ncbi:MAG: hypothetical protein MMC23_006654 [Stictis urceolatum]|nr:hypothetical protein [Stictis urceolata]
MQIFSAAIFLSLASYVAADCDIGPCGAIDPQFQGECGVDPADDTQLGLYQGYCPCEVGEPLEAAITYTGMDGGASSATSITNFDVANTGTYFTFDFAVTNTRIQPGSPITIIYSSSDVAAFPMEFTYSPVQSIFFAEATETVTSTDSVVTTTTSTATVTSTTALPRSTSTQPCTTGTLTKTARTSTTTLTLTTTPPPKTITIPRVSTTTTHLSCLSASASSTSNPTSPPRLHARALLPRANTDTYEVPFCPSLSGSPSPTTITTSTQIQVSTVTTTDTSTSTSTSTVLATQTPDPRTTTVCSRVRGTVTVTPTKTRTVTQRAARETRTSTKVKVVTKTVFEGGRPRVCPGPKTCTRGEGTGGVVVPGVTGTAKTTATGK